MAAQMAAAGFAAGLFVMARRLRLRVLVAVVVLGLAIAAAL